MGVQIHARIIQAKAPLLVPAAASPTSLSPATRKRTSKSQLISSTASLQLSLGTGSSINYLGSKKFNGPLWPSPSTINGNYARRLSRKVGRVVASSSSGNAAVSPFWESWTPDNKASQPSLSDILWPSLGAFAAMAMLGKIDQILAPKGISMTIAPLGAVCAVLFVTPSSPAARKYNMFMAQIGCAAIGVIALTLLGSGWLAKSVALATTIGFMVYTRCTHPPAASLPLLFIDGVKLHRLNYWYALFPGAAGCLLLCLIQEIVCYMKDNYKF